MANSKQWSQIILFIVDDHSGYNNVKTTVLLINDAVDKLSSPPYSVLKLGWIYHAGIGEKL